MHREDAERLVDKAVQQAVSLISAVLGNENMILLTELNSVPSVDLELAVLKRPEPDRAVFAVCTATTTASRYHEFDRLDKAKALYDEVRAAGSWSAWEEDQKRKPRKS